MDKVSPGGTFSHAYPAGGTGQFQTNPLACPGISPGLFGKAYAFFFAAAARAFLTITSLLSMRERRKSATAVISLIGKRVGF